MDERTTDAPGTPVGLTPVAGVPAGAPARADGIHLIGELPGSGYRVPPSLVRRGDGQTIQLTRLLYLVLDAVDGARSHPEIAGRVSEDYGRRVSAEDVAALEARLRQLGLLRLADGSEPRLVRSDPLLALRMRYAVTDPEVTRRLTAPFAALFHPVVVAVVVSAFLAVCGWLLVVQGLGAATHHAFAQPALLMGVLVLTVVSAGFHEFGHAAAARYGGATPGAMGAGLYLVWPAFYTDVTDSYRLGRAGRVRTDLGGLYFNAIVALVVVGAWWLTSWEALLLVVATQVLQMARQLAPFVRFDGYHVLADLTGVPDLYHRIGPTLRGLLPWRSEPGAAALKPWARAVVTVWVLLVVPLLLLCAVLVVLSLPRVLGTAWAALVDQTALLSDRLSDGDVLGALVRVLALVAITLPVGATVYMVVRLARQLLGNLWGSGRTPGRRLVAGLLTVVVTGGLAAAWWPAPDRYRPVQAYERGSVVDALPASLLGPGASLDAGRAADAMTAWPQDADLPTAERPALALVLVPRGGATPDAPVWVFPFDRPVPPDDDGNQALAVNTTDGSAQYDVAFALVWVRDGESTERNEAYALASCDGCTTVAVAFQVVLVVGRADTIVPENLAAAVNYACVDCLTVAIAQQLVLTLEGELSAESQAAVAGIMAELAAYGDGIADVPLAELRARLAEYERRIIEVVRADPASGLADVAPSEQGPAPEAEPRPSTTAAPGTPGEDAQPEPRDTRAPGSTTPAPTAPSEPAPVPTTEPTTVPTTEPAAEPGSGTTTSATP